MKKRLIITFLTLLAMDLSAQRSWWMGNDSVLQQNAVVLDLEGEAMYRSNGIDREMLNKLAFGGYISPELAERQEERVEDLMRFGGRYRGSLGFIVMADSVFGNQQWGWQGRVSANAHMEAAIPSGLYHLLFKGNADRLDQTVHIDQTWVDYMAYQKLGFGLVHKPTLSGFTISAVNGERFDRLSVLEGGLYTSALGDSISLSYNGTYSRSDTAVRGFGSGLGIGVALDGQLNIPLNENRGVVSIILHDIGFIAWNEASERFEADSLFSFTGVALDDIIDDDGDGLPSFRDSLYYTHAVARMTRWLPGRIQARLMHRISERDFFEADMTFRPVNVFDPQIRMGYYVYLNEHCMMGANATFGGYGKLRFGIAYEQWMANRLFMAVNLGDVYGQFSRQGLGMFAALRITYLIRNQNDQ